MSVHLFVHYLDLFRHDLAYAWAWTDWIGNIAAGIFVFFVMSLFWPRARRAIEAFAKRHVRSIHDKLDNQQEEKMHQAKKLHDAAQKEADRRHEEAMKLAHEHHKEHLSALNGLTVKSPPAKKVVPVKAPRKGKG